MSDTTDTLRSMIGELKAENAWLRERVLLWRRRANDLLLDAEDLECGIASALGWPDGGGPFDKQVRELRAEVERLRCKPENPSDAPLQ